MKDALLKRGYPETTFTKFKKYGNEKGMGQARYSAAEDSGLICHERPKSK